MSHRPAQHNRIFTQRCFLGLGLVLLLFAAAPAVQAECTLRELRTDTVHQVVMENAFVRMTVDVRHGGKVTAFLYKPLNREWLASGHGLFADHVWQQTWPGELYDAVYEAEIIARGPQRVAVKLSRTLEAPGQLTVRGIRLERTLELTDGSPAVTAEVTLRNPTQEVKTAGYWSQHIFRLGGLSDNWHIRPTTGGLSLATVDYRNEGQINQTLGDDFVKNPVAGWSATLNPITCEAAVFLMDFNDLRWLYNSVGGYTTEWYYDLLRMVPGRTWTTRFSLLPLSGYHGISFASPEIIADVRLVRAGKGFRLVYTLGTGGPAHSGLKLTARLASGQPGKATAHASETLPLPELGLTPVEIVSDLVLPSAPFTVEVEITGLKPAATFSKYVAEQTLADHLVAGEYPPPERFTTPPKQKQLERPGELRKLNHAGFATFEARGQFFPAWRLEEALGKLGENSLKPGNFSFSVYGEQLDYFPPGYDEIMALDAVVLNNVPAGAIGPEGLALLSDYVKNGGGLLVFGGWYAFGGGQYGNPQLAELLPVVSGKPFDIQPVPAGAELRIQPDCAWLKEIAFKEKSLVLWSQTVASLKPGAQVVIAAGDRPFLVTGTCGKGRVACVLASPSGTAPAGSALFCDAPEWPDLLARVLRWLKDGK